MMNDYLAGKLENAIPLVFRESRFCLQSTEIGNRSILAERQDQQVE